MTTGNIWLPSIVFALAASIHQANGAQRPCPWLQRNANIMVDDRYYTFASGPWDADLFPQALPDVERLWQTVSESIAFFDPWR